MTPSDFGRNPSLLSRFLHFPSIISEEKRSVNIFVIGCRELKYHVTKGLLIGYLAIGWGVGDFPNRLSDFEPILVA